MKKIKLFLRKKNSVHHHSLERFANTIFNRLKIENAEIEIVKCPITSKGFFKRLYLICWAFFNQGDVNHILGDINFISVMMNKKKTINTFLDCRLLSEFKGLKKMIYKYFWFKIPIIKSAKCTFISNFTRNEIMQIFGQKNKIKSEVIPVPIVNNVKIKNETSNNNSILIVGTEKHKNVYNMLKASKGLNVKFDIVGKLEKEIRDFLIIEKIKYNNYVDISDNQIINLYKRNSILMMVSKYEGFGMPILEAQQSGLAVITSNLEPMKSIAGKGAILVEPENIIQIRDGLIKLLNDNGLINTLINTGKNNLKRYKDVFVLDKYKKIYSEIINKS